MKKKTTKARERQRLTQNISEDRKINFVDCLGEVDIDFLVSPEELKATLDKFEAEFDKIYKDSL